MPVASRDVSCYARTAIRYVDVRRETLYSTTHPLADPSRDTTIFVIDLTAASEAPAPGGAAVSALSAADMPALEAAMHASGVYPEGVAGGRLGPDRHAYGIWADGQIVTYGWVAYTAEPLGNSGVAFRPPPGDAYIYDCATRPAYQGRGHYKALLRGIASDLRRRGCRRAWIGTEPGNIISQRGIVGAGFTKVADVNLTPIVDGVVKPELYGVPGVPEDVVAEAARSFLPVGQAPETS